MSKRGIITYENTVQHGALTTLEKENRLECFKGNMSRLEKIISADGSDESQQVSPEAAAGEQLQAKSSAAVREGAKKAVDKLKSVVKTKLSGDRKSMGAVQSPRQTNAQDMPGRTFTPRRTNSVRTRGVQKPAVEPRAARSAQGAVRLSAGAARSPAIKSAAQSVGTRATVETAKTAASATAKTAVSTTAGAASAGVTVAIQKGVEAASFVVNQARDAAEAASGQLRQAAIQSAAEEATPGAFGGIALAAVAVVIAVVVLLITPFVTLFGAAGGAGRAVNLNARVEGYRTSVTRWATEYGIGAYTEVLLALCMAETGSVTSPPDPFACSESGYAVKQPDGITDPEYSIEIGVYVFSLMLKRSGCTSPADRNGLFLALQGYNMGPGFIDFCKKNYGGIWSREAAAAFEQHMGGNYGNPNYVEQFLRFYEFGSAPGSYPGALNAYGLSDPLNPGWRQSITQHFGEMFSGTPHKGLDVGMPEGTPIYATADGKVIVANSTDSWGYSWGYYVKINHSEVHDTLYAHMSRVAVQQGQFVRQGELIGYVGSTGNSSGNHLHFELYLNGTRVDPEPYIGTDALYKYLLVKI